MPKRSSNNLPQKRVSATFNVSRTLSFRSPAKRVSLLPRKFYGCLVYFLRYSSTEARKWAIVCSMLTNDLPPAAFL